MNIGFRNGIISRQETGVNIPSYLIFTSGSPYSTVSLDVVNTPFVATYINGDSNYTIQEFRGYLNAWNGIEINHPLHYLYIDLSIISGKVEFVVSNYPIVISGVEPSNPADGYVWFDTNVNKFKVFSNTVWQIKCRILAGILDENNIITYPPVGSQVNITGDFTSGYILFDDTQKPLFKTVGGFVTTADNVLVNISTINNSYTGVKYESYRKIVTSNVFIAKYTAVRIVDVGGNVLPSGFNRVSGILVEDLYANETARIVDDGKIEDPIFFNFAPEEFGKPLWSNVGGQLTTTVPTIGIAHQIGRVIDEHSIVVSIATMPVVLVSDVSVFGYGTDYGVYGG